MADVSIRGAILFAFRFMIGSWQQILRVVWLPLLAGWCVLYFFSNLYLDELVALLGDGQGRHASVVLGALSGGLLLWMFCLAVMVVGLTELALGKTLPGTWIYFRISRDEWRLYSGNLRFSVVLLLIVVLFSGVAVATGLPLPGSLEVQGQSMASTMLNILLVLAVSYTFVTIGFLIPPVSVIEKGQIVRRSWRLAAKRFLPLAALVTALVCPGILLYIAGEWFLHAVGLVSKPAEGASVADYATFFQGTLPAMLTVIVVSCLVHAVLLTGGAVSAYRDIALAQGEQGASA